MITPGAFSDGRVVAAFARRIRESAERADRPFTLMEVCGTHTHAIAAAGLRRLLPPKVRLISGPGCPVCVTSVEYLDRAEALAEKPGTIVCTFGDLLRVPSTRGSLEVARGRGCDVRVVYSPRDALDVARANRSSRVVFLAVGFETTTPTIAAALEEAERDRVDNFMILPGNKTVPPPLRALASDEALRLDGLLLPGHVSVITGWKAFSFLADEYGIPSAVVGFTPADIMMGIEALVGMLSDRSARVVNLYGRIVTPEGNVRARELMDRFFQPAGAVWRGLGLIPGSGLALRDAWRRRDASLIEVDLPEAVEPPGCRCGEVLKGVIDPPACPLFAKGCTPDDPVGACMVSSEGTCAAWYRHERFAAGAAP